MDKELEKAKRQRRIELVQRMKEENPMYNPETAKRISERMKGNQNAKKDKKEVKTI